ncbi:MAG TPA: GMC oxidoreductase [Methylomirabilota bacterium]|nr:GMC oxidoreductase [Methylomirabilota bacterium]
MPRLASPIAGIKPQYDVVIVGSGYGGAIAASRLARAKKAGGGRLSVCVLERGREFQPGEYPDTPAKVLGEIQLHLPGLRFFSRTGLYDFRFNDDINVFVGCGLGGTSLINAGVSLCPEPAVFSAPWWPQGLLEDMAGLRLGFARAEEMLAPTPLPLPPEHPTPRKLQALEKSARQLGATVTRPPINVTFTEGANRFGVPQHACECCGDCVSGCNYAAKNTLIMNYLPDAKAHGAEMYTEVSVRFVEPAGDRWAVHYELLDAGRERFAPPPMVVKAETVILAAGTLGSTEILLRSACCDPVSGKPRLALSPRLGERFSSNGDMVAVSYNGEEPLEAVGLGRYRSKGREPVGPTITGSIDLRRRSALDEGMVIQEGAIPGAIAAFIPPVLAVASVLTGRWPWAKRQSLRLQIRRWIRCLRGAYRGAVRSTQTFLVMSHDAAAGSMRLDPRDRLRVEWPGVDRQPFFSAVNDRLWKASAPLRGAYIRNPYKPMTVHPLGGCIMADHPDHGVVDHEGQVFRTDGVLPSYKGLYVCDGSIIPRSLGINPLLTISALAERMCARLANHKRWTIDYDSRVDPPVAPARPSGIWFSERLRSGLGFSERMTGWIGDAEAVPEDEADTGEAETEDVARFKAACQRAARRGEQADTGFEAIFTVISDDLERMLTEPRHEARLVGTVRALALSERPMTVRDGYFHFLKVDPDRVETRQMVYRMRLISDTGRSYFVWGVKEARKSLPWKCWGDLTTLYVAVVADGPDGQADPSLRLGILRLSGGNVLRQLSTIRTRHVRRFVERIDGPVRFLGAFLKIVRNLYGHLLADSIIATPDAPPPRWPQRARPAPIAVETSDGFWIHLTRYRGDPNRPVILAPGLGVAGSSYAADTVETNLVEYLGARGYDVWLLDYRASPEFLPPEKPFSIDDIALRDWPAAVDEVLRQTGAAQVQILAHCVSALALMMSLLDGRLDGKVRSVICSQVGAHPVVAPQNEVKVGIYLANVLRLFGVRQLTASFNARTWSSWALDQLFRLIPTRERCNSPVCRRILFIFHESFHHAQLNTETHDAMWRWYGAANLTAMKHLAVMIREGQLVDAEGRDVYVGNDLGHDRRFRLTLPISFMHGSLNRAFLPRSTLKTYEWLVEKNDRAWYQRQEFPEYGHMDCFVGRRAAEDVYPWIAAQLADPPRPR